ncbi:PAS domain-containing protein, partial [Rhodocytophaga aerolata]
MALTSKKKIDQVPAPTGKENKPKKLSQSVEVLSLQADTQYLQTMEALIKSQAVIEFTMDGRILTANDNFLQILGYQLKEIKGKHHQIFCTEEQAKSKEYKQFWAQLQKGGFNSGQFQRIAKDGSTIWIQATYNVVMDERNNPYKVIKFVTDITELKKTEITIEHTAEQIEAQQQILRQNEEQTQAIKVEMDKRQLELQGQIAALNNAAIVSEVDLRGNILFVNDEFCRLAKYTREEL